MSEKSSQFLSSDQPSEPESLDVALMLSETPFSCDAVRSELLWAVLCSPLCRELAWNIRIGKQGYVFIWLYKITEILRTLWLVKRVAKPMFYCTGKPRFPNDGSFRREFRELGTLAITKCNKQFCLSLAEKSITRMSFRSTYTWKFQRKNRARRWSAYQAFYFLAQQNFYADSG